MEDFIYGNIQIRQAENQIIENNSPVVSRHYEGIIHPKDIVLIGWGSGCSCF